MKPRSEMIEGPEAWNRFNSTMKHVMTVTPQELKRRLEAERKASASNPHRRGPKSKRADHGPADQPHV
jgi:hypothetical protein